DLSVMLDPPTWRRSDWIEQVVRRGDQGRLFDIPLGHCAAAALKKSAQLGFQVRLDFEAFIEDIGNRFPSEVVLGRAKAAGSDDHVRAVECLFERGAQTLQVVADLRDVVQVYAQRR